VALPLNFHFLIKQFFVIKYKDIILKCNETFSGKYMEYKTWKYLINLF